ncbi:MAG: efflux RND transporter periplasmic adaptor subunit, partial [Planctomycetes bacterium]|nr:efflux RND transporter periplasmic adaptor subunit [Planctomycetota bacterium]
MHAETMLPVAEVAQRRVGRLTRFVTSPFWFWFSLLLLIAGGVLVTIWARSGADDDGGDGFMRGGGGRGGMAGAFRPNTRGGGRGGGGAPGEARAGAPIPVKVALVETGDISSVLTLYTTLRARREIDVLAKAGGIVERVAVEVGDAVGAEQVLAKLEEAKVALDLRRATVERDSAKRELDRRQELFAQGNLPQRDLDDAQRAYDGADLTVKSMDLQLLWTAVSSPIEGTVSARYVEVGNNVAVNQRLFHVVDLSHLEAEVHAPESAFGRVRVGDAAWILRDPDSPGGEKARAPGAVSIVAPVVDRATGTFAVTVKVTAADSHLSPGRFANVELAIERRAGRRVIPRRALVADSEHDAVYRFEPASGAGDDSVKKAGAAASKERAGKAALTRVTLGLTQGERVEVTDGLNVGDEI